MANTTFTFSSSEMHIRDKACATRIIDSWFAFSSPFVERLPLTIAVNVTIVMLVSSLTLIMNLWKSQYHFAGSFIF
jgi:hypothetical protein